MQDDDDFVLSGIDDDPGDVPDGDSGVLQCVYGDSNGLRVIKNGCCTIVKFHQNVAPDLASMAEYREQVYELSRDPACELMRFDLTGLPFLPSGMLGLLTTVKNRGIDVEISNANELIRDSLSVTRLDAIIRICE